MDVPAAMSGPGTVVGLIIVMIAVRIGQFYSRKEAWTGIDSSGWFFWICWLSFAGIFYFQQFNMFVSQVFVAICAAAFAVGVVMIGSHLLSGALNWIGQLLPRSRGD